MNCLKCEKCNYSTTFKQRFTLHLQSKRHLEERINEYKCEKCNYTTTFKHCFETHLQSKRHLEEKINEYKCEKCQYTTKNKQNFEIHLQSKKHTEEKQKFEPIFCKYCEIQPPVPAPSPVPPAPSSVPPAPSPIPIVPEPLAVTTISEPKKPSIDFYKPFFNTALGTPERIEAINQVLTENEEKLLPEDTYNMRIYARKIGEDYKVAVIPLDNKADYFQLGLLKKEKLKEIIDPKRGYENVDDDDDGCGGFHFILGYIRSDKIDS